MSGFGGFSGFGGANTNSQSKPTFSFGQPSASSSAPATNSTPSFSFGKPSTPSASPAGPAPAASGGFSFGGAGASNPPGSQSPAAPSAATQKPAGSGFSFGGNANTSAASSSAAPTATTTTPAHPPPSNLFGSGGFSGGNSGFPGAKPAGAGENKQTQGSTSAAPSLFGGGAADTSKPAGGFSFGAAPKAGDADKAKGTEAFSGSSQLLGKPATSPATSSAPTPASGAAGGAASSGTSGFSFGSFKPPAADNAPTGAQKEATPSSSALPSSTSTQAPTSTAAAPPTFSFGKSGTEAKAGDDKKPGAGAPASGGEVPGTAGAGPKGGSSGTDVSSTSSGLNFGKNTSAAPGASSGAASTKVDASTAAPGNSSTGPPTLSVAPQPAPSLLRGRNMDEIVSTWTASLSTSIASFSKLSGEILVWDDLLRRSGSEISALLHGLNSVEEAQSRVEQLLDYIEGQQNDLEGLLDGYEREVDELRELAIGVVGQGKDAGSLSASYGVSGRKAGLKGGEVERERMYTLAETLEAQLSDLGANLSSMINEINGSLGEHQSQRGKRQPTNRDTNGASALGVNASSEEEDPVQQILAILNAHLNSLRWIDSATKALRVRIQGLRRGVIE